MILHVIALLARHFILYYTERLLPDTLLYYRLTELKIRVGGGPRVVVSTAAFYAGVRGSVPGLGGFKEIKNVSSSSTCESQYYGEPP